MTMEIIESAKYSTQVSILLRWHFIKYVSKNATSVNFSWKISWDLKKNFLKIHVWYLPFCIISWYKSFAVILIFWYDIGGRIQVMPFLGKLCNLWLPMFFLSRRERDFTSCQRGRFDVWWRQSYKDRKDIEKNHWFFSRPQSFISN